MSTLLSKKSQVDLNPFAIIKLISSIFLYFPAINEMAVKNGGKKGKSPYNKEIKDLFGGHILHQMKL